MHDAGDACLRLRILLTRARAANCQVCRSLHCLCLEPALHVRRRVLWYFLSSQASSAYLVFVCGMAVLLVVASDNEECFPNIWAGWPVLAIDGALRSVLFLRASNSDDNATGRVLYASWSGF